MRTAVVVPPIRDFYFTPQRASFLGALTVRTVLEGLGHDTIYFPFPAIGKHKPIPVPKELSHLAGTVDPRETGSAAFFTSYRRFGPPFSLCAERIVETRPDVVMISSIAYCYIEDAYELAGEIRRIAPQTPVVAGGPGVSAAGACAAGHFDVTVIGEAENVIQEAITAAFSGRESGREMASEAGEIIEGTRVEEIPFVYHLHRTKRRTYITTQLTRGCPYRCAFCSSHLIFGRQMRWVSLSNLESALTSVDAAGPVHVNLEDDNLLRNRAYAEEVFRLLRARWPDLSLSAENGIDYRGLDESDMEALFDHGFTSFNFTLASAEEAVLEGQGRAGETQRLGALVRRAHSLGASSTTYFICGLAGDSPRSVVATLAILAGIPTRVGISPFYPVPGLPGFDGLAYRSDISPRLCAGSSLFPWTGSLTTAELLTAFRISRLLNLAKKQNPSPEENALVEDSFGRRRLLSMRRGYADPLAPKGIDRNLESLFFASVRRSEIRPAH